MKRLIVILFSFFNIYSFSQDTFYRHYTFDFADEYVKRDTSSQNLWQIAKPNKTILDEAYSDSLVMITHPSDFYMASNTSIFEFKLTLPDTSSGLGTFGDGEFKFKHKYDTEIGKAGGYVEISYDDGLSWTNALIDKTFVSDWGPEFENMYTENDTLDDGTPCFHGTENEWIDTRIWWFWNAAVKRDQPEWWGWGDYDTLRVRFVFKSLDGALENHEGWMIDDLEITINRIYGNIQENNFNAFQLFPNPAIDELIIESNTNIFHSYFTIFDITGREVVAKTKIENSVQNINITDLRSGTYIIQVSDESNQFSKVFIKQ